ncbi:MAG: ribose-5-phosphate isomerase RpiA [Syntrophales bacterium]
MDVATLKERAARRAVEWVESGMIVGLGHGSTAAFAVERIAELIRSGALENLRAIPCSREVHGVAKRLGIPLTDLNRNPVIDLTIDGADEVDDALNLIKGGGGALLREKIVAQASLREVIVADESKMSPAFGTRCAVPLEVLPFGWRSHIRFLENLGARVTVRRRGDGTIFRTDQNNILLDAHFGPIADPPRLAADLKARAGIIEHGLFLQVATDVVVAGEGGIRHLVRG